MNSKVEFHILQCKQFSRIFILRIPKKNLRNAEYKEIKLTLKLLQERSSFFFAKIEKCIQCKHIYYNFRSMSTTNDAIMSVRIPSELKKQFQKYAKEYRRSPASILKEQIESFIETQEAMASESFQKRLAASRASEAIPAEQVWKELGL